MDKFERHRKQHLLNRSGWLRAAVLGANDGILSTASLLSGIAAAGAEHRTIVLAGVAALVAGAFSMATGEYVSVSSQADIENADLNREKHDLIANPVYEHEELAHIYVQRGLTPELAKEVANQLMTHNALEAHARDELGISAVIEPHPLQAAFSSATSFSLGAALPLVTAVLSPEGAIAWAVFAASLIALTILGFVAARLAGNAPGKPVLRIVLWGTISMGLTALIGSLSGSQL
jgi:VIT1/CCC1 family predicted Fe2+/Mn2+ transporter